MDNRAPIVAALANAKPIDAPADDGPAPPGGGDQPPPPDRPRRPGDEAPWPVIPLGYNGGDHFFLRHRGDLMKVTTKQLTQWADQLHLWSGDDQDLIDRWQAADREGNPVNDWVAKRVGRALISASNLAGLFDPASIRSTGVWHYVRAPGEVEDSSTPKLVCHCGDAVALIRPGKPPRWVLPGRHGQHLYIAGPPEIRPGRSGVKPTIRNRLTSLLSAWAWEKPGVEPYLYIGWLGVALITGALSWRPSIWVTGQSGSGKSALMGVAQAILGSCLLPAADPTEASIRRALNNAARPVQLNEMEAGEQQERLDAIIKLARLTADDSATSSGATITRADEVYRVVATFYCTAVLIPPLKAADESRFVVLRVRPLATLGAAAWRKSSIEAAIADARDIGPSLRRHLLDQFPRVQKLIAAWREYFAGKNYKPREQDQYGILLALAWAIMRDDTPNEDDFDAWGAWLEPATVDISSDERACLNRLLTFRTPDWDHGVRPTVAELIDWVVTDSLDYKARAKAALARMGLVLWPTKLAAGAFPSALAIANQHNSLDEIYRNTTWEGGVYVQTLRRLDGAEAAENPVRFAAIKVRATLLPLGLVWEPGDAAGQTAQAPIQP